MPNFTLLARNTLILSWFFVAWALAFTVTLLYQNCAVPEAFIVAALFVGVLLVSQTTWAIVDEGAGEHQGQLSRKAAAAVAKVHRTERTNVYIAG